MTVWLTPQEVKAKIGAGGELALLDVREEGVFSEAHLLHARSLPLSRLELRIRAFVPRRATPIVLIDADGDGPAAKAAEVLAACGYDNLAVLQGGIEGWRAAGLEIFSGVNVPSKAFGEFVEVSYETPRMPAAEVKALMDAGADMVVLDSRPFDEFHRMNIPSGVDSPGAELALRVHDMAPSPDTLVVVNCAGRTRSIIGCQSLINAGIPNRIVALKDGTMGWHLAGFSLETGQTRVAPAPTAAGLKRAKAVADRVAKRFGVKTISQDTLTAWEAEQDRRSLYLLDVRSPEEFLAGHRAGSRSAPGGQLVQATDEYVGTLGSRIVLIDDNGVRATMTASWLIQMGWSEAVVLQGGLAGALESGPPPLEVPGLAADEGGETVTVQELRAILDSGEPAKVIDLADSLAYRRGHIPGAAWALRGRFDGLGALLWEAGLVIVTGDDEAMLRLAEPELAAVLPKAILRRLEGGNKAWRDAGLPLESGLTWALTETDDRWYKPYDNDKGVEQRMRDYLTWEVALVEQIERDGDANFLRFD